MDSIIIEKWEKVRTRLRAEFGDAAFNSWLKPLQIEGIDGPHVTLSAPTRFMRDWVTSHYGEKIRSIWHKENASILDIKIQVRPRPNLPELNNRKSVEEDSQIRPPVDTKSSSGKNMGSPLDLRFHFDSFVVGKSNELAYAAARRVADSPSVTFNPLFLYGGVGLGKTHLMHAIAWHIRQKDPSRKVIYLSAEKFMYQFIRALRDRDAMTFKHGFRSVDVLLIDDVQFFSR